MEVHEHLGGARQVLVRQRRVPVPMGEPLAQRMPVRDRGAPVEHLLPVGHIGDGGRLDKEAGVAGLPIRSRHRVTILALARQGEEVG